MMLSVIVSVATCPPPRVRIGPVMHRSIVSVLTWPLDPEAAGDQLAAVGGDWRTATPATRRRLRGGDSGAPGIERAAQ